MKLYRTKHGVMVERAPGEFVALDADWDEVINRPALAKSARQKCRPPAPRELLPPIGSQEVWAAGVTYYRSRDARMEESKESGGSDFYAKVYAADRPELFFKASPQRVVGAGGKVRLRADSKWNVPEPELTLVINRAGAIVGYTIGNDMSSRNIEGENPLYLPQAKVYDGSCALGPCVLLSRDALPVTTSISIAIQRDGEVAFQGSTTLAQIKRKLPELVEFLYRETSFPSGAYLMTGTGIVPNPGFTLRSKDRIRITIESIGVLENVVE